MKLSCMLIFLTCSFWNTHALTYQQQEHRNESLEKFDDSICKYFATCAAREDKRSYMLRGRVRPPPINRSMSPPTPRSRLKQSPERRYGRDITESRSQTGLLTSHGGITMTTTTSTTEAPYEESYADTEHVPCYCDAQCHLYGDCCKDKSSRVAQGATPRTSVTESQTLPPGTVMTEHFSCALLNPDYETQPSQDGIYVVSRCPDSTPLLLSSKCHKTAPDSKFSYILDVPVVSNKTNTVYANIFCAKCHDDDSIVKYNFSISCNCDLGSKSYLKKMKYNKDDRIWRSSIPEGVECIAGTKTAACALSLLYPENIGRRCERNLISKCSSDWNNWRDEKLCASYNYYVEYGRLYFYKNPDCARCNNLSVSDIRCLHSDFSTRIGSSRIKLFHLSDLFSSNDDCSHNQVFDIIDDKCSDMSPNDSSNSVMNVIYIVLMSFSLLAMVFHMAIFLILIKKRSLHTKNLFSMTMSLFWAEFLLLICAAECTSEVGCYISTIIIYYLFMVAFFWMNAMSYDVCKTFRSTKLRGNSHRTYIKYTIYCTVTPALLTAIAVMVDLLAPNSDVSPGFGNGFWFSNRGGLLLFFIGPTEFVFLINIIFLCVSMYDIFQHQKMSKFATTTKRKPKPGNIRNEEHDKFIKNTSTDPTEEKVTEASKLNQLQGKIKESVEKFKFDKERLVLYLKLALIMGVPWFFAIFDHMSVICQHIFNILNAIQGLFIFIAFDCKRKVLYDVCERLGWTKMAESLSSSSGTQDTVTSSTGSRSRHTKVPDVEIK